jgi:nucleoside-diphosphate-sugar epimerase
LIDAITAVGSPRLVVQSFCGWPWAEVGGPVKSEEDPLDDSPPKAFRRTLQAIRTLEALVVEYPAGVALRYGGLYGPGTSLGEGGAQTVAVRKGRLPLVGTADAIWSFLHVADAASAGVAALGRGRGIYNVVDDDPAPVRDWLPELARLVGGPPPKRVPVWLARLVGGDGLVRMMTTTARGSSNAKARAELGWAPGYPSWRDGFAVEFGSPQSVRP